MTIYREKVSPYSLACGCSRLPSGGCVFKPPRETLSGVWESLSRGFEIATARRETAVSAGKPFFGLLNNSAQDYNDSSFRKLMRLEANSLLTAYMKATRKPITVAQFCPVYATSRTNFVWVTILIITSKRAAQFVLGIGNFDCQKKRVYKKTHHVPKNAFSKEEMRKKRTFMRLAGYSLCSFFLFAFSLSVFEFPFSSF